jgi:uncharacterized protein
MINLRRTVAGLAAATLILGASPALCADAPAPSAHNLELARHLFAGMHMDTMLDNLMKTIAPAMMEQARKTNPSLSEKDAQVISQAVGESERAMMGKMVDRMIPLYASTFTEKELQDAVTFYEGPSGKAMLQKMPELMAKMGPTMAELMPEMTADLQQRICSKIDCTKRAAPAAPKG